MGTSSWNRGDWARFGVSALAGYVINTKRNTESAAKKAKALANQQAVNAQTQTNIAEDERLRRLRLLQGGSANTMEEATGRKTLLGQ